MSDQGPADVMIGHKVDEKVVENVENTVNIPIMCWILANQTVEWETRGVSPGVLRAKSQKPAPNRRYLTPPKKELGGQTPAGLVVDIEDRDDEDEDDVIVDRRIDLVQLEDEHDLPR